VIKAKLLIVGKGVGMALSRFVAYTRSQAIFYLATPGVGFQREQLYFWGNNPVKGSFWWIDNQVREY